MIDFHTHILPGMDDGSRSVEQSLAMLREEARQGVDTVVATSHFYAHQNDIETFLRRRSAAWGQLEPALEPGMPRILLGAEVQYFEGICGVEDLPKLRTEGSRLLLLEMPFRRWSDRVISDAIDLNDRDEYQVILAHVERYLQWQPRGICETMRRSGLELQCNASFFTGWRTRHRAMSMLKKGQVQVLGSDCHNLKDRAPDLGAAWKIIGKETGCLRGDLCTTEGAF